MKFKITLIICAVVLAAALFLVSPFFGATEIIIVGNATVSRAEIEDRLDFVLGDNILLLNTAAARRRVMENLYIDQVSFSRTLPGQLVVTVQERRLIAYVEHAPGSFLFLDNDGRVLEVRTFFTEPLPVVRGLEINSFQLGEVLDVPNRIALSIVAQYAQVLQAHGLATLVQHIDVTDVHNTRILFPNIEFNVGDAREAEKKVRLMAAVINYLPDVAAYRGFMDLREISGQYFFRFVL